MEEQTTVGLRIKKLREQLELKQADFAQQLSEDPKKISRIEKEVQFPDSNFLIQLGDRLDVSLDWILRGVGSRIAAGLRDTDAVGRISEDSFGVMVVDAVEGSGPMIVSRWESELLGQLVDDGAGGMIEINLENSFRRCELTGLENLDSSEIAARLLSKIEQSLAKPS